MKVPPIMPHLQHHIPARHEHRQLESVAQQLQQACARLQEERVQLQQQQRLLLHLTDVFGHLRSKLQDEDDLFQLPPTGLEDVLLSQLAVGTAARQVPGAGHAGSFSAGSSTDSNSSVSSDKPESGQTPNEDDVSRTITSRTDSILQDTCSSGSQPSHLIRQRHRQQQGVASSTDQADMCSQGCTAQASSSTSGNPAVPDQEPSSAAGAAGGVQCGVSSALLANLVQPVCPDSDPFLLLRLANDAPPHPAASTASLQELQQLLSSQVQQLRVYLAQLHRALQRSSLRSVSPAPAGPADGSSPRHVAPAAAAAAGGAAVAAAAAAAAEPSRNPLQGIRDVQMQVFVLVQSLVSLGRSRDYFELQLTNWDTGEKLAAPCMQRHRAALQELQLSPPPLQRMAAGHRFFQGLLLPLVAERKRLHALGLAAIPPPGPAAAAAAAAAGGAGAEPGGEQAGSSSRGMGPVGAAMLAQQASSLELGRGAGLQAQRESLARMRLLMRKDLMLRGAMTAYMQGCLSWVQQAKLRICMSPYHVNMGIFCACLMEQVVQQQQVLQQQGLSINPNAAVPSH